MCKRLLLFNLTIALALFAGGCVGSEEGDNRDGGGGAAPAADDGGQTNSGATTAGPGATTGDSEFNERDQLGTQAVALLDQHCMSCHVGVAGATDWGISAGASWETWRDSTPVGLIVPGDAAASRLTVRMLHSPAGGNMPPGATAETYPVAHYELIARWVNQLPLPGSNGGEVDGATTGATTGEDAGPRPLALDYLDQHCLNCHNGSGAPTNWGVVAGATAEDWQRNTQQGLIVAGDAAASRLVRFMIYSTNGTMPPSATPQTFPQSVFDEIVSWINELEPLDVDGGAEDELKAGDGLYLESEKLRLGDRNYVADTLVQIFGPSSQADLIRGLLLPFGGPCPELRGWSEGRTGAECMSLGETMDFSGGTESFETNGSYTNMLAAKHVDSIDLVTSGAPVVPSSTVVREGNRTLACEQLLLDQAYNGGDPTVALLHALQAVADTVDVLDGNATAPLDFTTYPAANSRPSDHELSVAHMLFYNYQPPAANQLVALRAVAERARQADITAVGDWPKRFEPWRYVMLTLCNSPAWQLP